MSPLVEWLAVGFGLAYVLMAVPQWRGCWLAGGASAALFLLVFWRAQLPTQSVLQVYYIAIAVHGWWHWGRASDPRGPLPVRRWPARYHLIAIAAVAALTAFTVLLRHVPIGLTPILDAATGWGGALATWMVARKVLENWLYWIALNSAAVFMYLDSGLTATAMLYALYACIAVFGWFQWRRTLKPPTAY